MAIIKILIVCDIDSIEEQDKFKKIIYKTFNDTGNKIKIEIKALSKNSFCIFTNEDKYPSPKMIKEIVCGIYKKLRSLIPSSKRLFVCEFKAFKTEKFN